MHLLGDADPRVNEHEDQVDVGGDVGDCNHRLWLPRQQPHQGFVDEGACHPLIGGLRVNDNPESPDKREEFHRAPACVHDCVRACACACACACRSSEENSPYSKINKKQFLTFFLKFPKNKIDIFLTLKYIILFIIHNNTFNI